MPIIIQNLLESSPFLSALRSIRTDTFHSISRNPLQQLRRLLQEAPILFSHHRHRGSKSSNVRSKSTRCFVNIFRHHTENLKICKSTSPPHHHPPRLSENRPLPLAHSLLRNDINPSKREVNIRVLPQHDQPPDIKYPASQQKGLIPS